MTDSIRALIVEDSEDDTFRWDRDVIECHDGTTGEVYTVEADEDRMYHIGGCSWAWSVDDETGS